MGWAGWLGSGEGWSDGDDEGSAEGLGESVHSEVGGRRDGCRCVGWFEGNAVSMVYMPIKQTISPLLFTDVQNKRYMRLNYTEIIAMIKIDWRRFVENVRDLPRYQ